MSKTSDESSKKQVKKDMKKVSNVNNKDVKKVKPILKSEEVIRKDKKIESQKKVTNVNNIKKQRKSIITIVIILIMMTTIFLTVYFLIIGKSNKSDGASDIVNGNKDNSYLENGNEKVEVPVDENAKNVVNKMRVEGNAIVESYDSNNWLLKELNLDSKYSVESYGSFYPYKDENYMEIILKNSIELVKIKGTGSITLSLFVGTVDGEPIKTYKIENVDVTDKECNITISFDRNAVPTFKLLFGDNIQDLQPIIEDYK